MGDSELLLTLVLERRFGVAWVDRWEALPDAELRWLAIYLADRDAQGQALDGPEQAASFVELGRRWLPETLRSARPAATLVALLDQAELRSGRVAVVGAAR